MEWNRLQPTPTHHRHPHVAVWSIVAHCTAIGQRNMLVSLRCPVVIVSPYLFPLTFNPMYLRICRTTTNAAGANVSRHYRSRCHRKLLRSDKFTGRSGCERLRKSRARFDASSPRARRQRSVWEPPRLTLGMSITGRWRRQC